jgi:hypothetical protein
MTKQHRKQATTISREDLYRQMWQTPASRLCAQYGISGRGLKKICDRLNVPSPPRGYWARLAAGKRIKQTPLPDAAPGAVLKVTITPSISETPAAPALDTETSEKLQAARAAAADISVPAKLSRPHPAIAAWIGRHQREITHDRTVWGRTLTEPFTKLERRQQRILSTLFKTAEKLGYKVKGEPPYKMSLETGRNTVAFRLRERIKQVRRRLTPEEKTKRYYSDQEWTQERFATNELILSIDTWIGRGLPREWRDGEQSLEQQIPDVVAVLAVVGPILEEWRLQTEAAERHRREEEMRRYEEKQKRDRDRNRWRRFIEFAQAWREAQLAGDFIKALEDKSADPDAVYDGRSAADWLAWARDRRSAFDPARFEIGDLWSDIGRVTAWGDFNSS